jgi:hypothetical protein
MQVLKIWQSKLKIKRCRYTLNYRQINGGNFAIQGLLEQNERDWGSETTKLSTVMRMAMNVQFPLRQRINYMNPETLTILRKIFY